MDKNLSSRKRLEPFKCSDCSEIDLILAPWGFGGTDNLAQEGAHSFVEKDMLRKLESVGQTVNLVEPEPLGPFHIQEDPDKIRNLDAILQINTWLTNRVEQSYKDSHFPITLGGDGSLSIATVAAFANHTLQSNEISPEEIGVLWLNNHLCNSAPRVTKSWNLNRMAFTAMSTERDLDEMHEDFKNLLISHKKNFPASEQVTNGANKPILPRSNIVHFGISHRSAKAETTHEYFTMEDIGELSIKEAINSAIASLDHCKKIHLIWDVNSMDVSGVSNYCPGQLTYREALMIARTIDTRIRRKDRLASIDFVEHCPSREAWDKRGETAKWVTDIAANIFGETIFNQLRKY